MLGSIGTTELLIIAGVLMLFFGGAKIPELFRGMNDSIKEFKKGLNEEEDTDPKKK